MRSSEGDNQPFAASRNSASGWATVRSRQSCCRMEGDLRNGVSSNNVGARPRGADHGLAGECPGSSVGSNEPPEPGFSRPVVSVVSTMGTQDVPINVARSGARPVSIPVVVTLVCIRHVRIPAGRLGGELLMDIRHVVCSSLTHVFSCAFGTCGMVTCARCGPCVTDCYDCCDSYDCGSCDCGGAVTTSDCGCHGGSSDESLGNRSAAPAAVDEQGNPFRDDPAKGTGAMGTQQTMRTRRFSPRRVRPHKRSRSVGRFAERAIRSPYRVLPNCQPVRA